MMPNYERNELVDVGDVISIDGERVIIEKLTEPGFIY